MKGLIGEEFMGGGEGSVHLNMRDGGGRVADLLGDL